MTKAQLLLSCNTLSISIAMIRSKTGKWFIVQFCILYVYGISYCTHVNLGTTHGNVPDLACQPWYAALTCSGISNFELCWWVSFSWSRHESRISHSLSKAGISQKSSRRWFAFVICFRSVAPCSDFLFFFKFSNTQNMPIAASSTSSFIFPTWVRGCHFPRVRFYYRHNSDSLHGFLRLQATSLVL